MKNLNKAKKNDILFSWTNNNEVTFYAVSKVTDKNVFTHQKRTFRKDGRGINQKLLSTTYARILTYKEFKKLRNLSKITIINRHLFSTVWSAPNF